MVTCLAYLIMKLPASTIILTEAKSCNALLRMLLVCTSICLKSVLRYTVLILDTYHPHTIHVREQGLEDPWLFFEAKRGPREKTFGQHCTKLLIKLYIYMYIYLYIYIYVHIYIYIYMGRVAQSA